VSIGAMTAELARRAVWSCPPIERTLVRVTA
jgi:hypothetical protein